MLKSYTVFNISQCDGLPDKLTAPPMPLNPDQREALIDEFVATNMASTLIALSGDEAFYRGGDADFIAMPAFEFFRGRAHFCATLFHELVHATGHPSRLDRRMGARFGLQAHSAQELVAELGAAFLCAEFSIDGDVMHARYIEHYLELLENDAKAIKILTEPIAANDSPCLSTYCLVIDARSARKGTRHEAAQTSAR